MDGRRKKIGYTGKIKEKKGQIPTGPGRCGRGQNPRKEKEHHVVPMYIIVRRAALHGLVEQQGLAHILDLGDSTLEVKGLGKNDFEDLGWVSPRSNRKLGSDIPSGH